MTSSTCRTPGLSATTTVLLNGLFVSVVREFRINCLRVYITNTNDNVHHGDEDVNRRSRKYKARFPPPEFTARVHGP